MVLKRVAAGASANAVARPFLLQKTSVVCVEEEERERERERERGGAGAPGWLLAARAWPQPGGSGHPK